MYTTPEIDKTDIGKWLSATFDPWICESPGNVALYGLGIRLGFYLSWLASIIDFFIGPSESRYAEQANVFAMFALFSKLLVDSRAGSVSSVDAYIANLFTYGAHYFIFSSIYYWLQRLRSKAMPRPSFWTRIFAILFFGMLAANSGYFTWFWYSGIYRFSGPRRDCKFYGFAIARVLFYDQVFVAVNLFLNSLLLIHCLMHLYFVLPLRGYVRGKGDDRAEKPEKDSEEEVEKVAEEVAETDAANEVQDESISEEHSIFSKLLAKLIPLAVAGFLMAAVELTIRRNYLTGPRYQRGCFTHVNDPLADDQAIEFTVGVVALTHILYVGCSKLCRRYRDHSHDNRLV